MNQSSSSRYLVLIALILPLLGFSGAVPLPIGQKDNPEIPDLTNFESQNLYLPIIQKPSEIFVGDLEITQATQNLITPVELVANRPSVLRIYARSITNFEKYNITANVKAYRNDVLIGQITQFNGTAFPLSTSLDSMRADKAKSITIQLPASWITSGKTNLSIELINGNDSSLPFLYSAYFREVPELNIVAVPIRLNQDYGPSSTSYLHQAIFRMYPVPSVNIINHTSYDFIGDLRNSSSGDWSRLLDEITTLKYLEVGYASNIVYFGVIPLANQNGYTWFSPAGGTLGLGWVGERVSIGVSNELFRFPQPYYPGWYSLSGSDTAAHEIGHNFGRKHTFGCGATYPDPSYPYAGGVIGQYGYQFSDQTVISKSFNDIMNYCDNQWISDYTYNGLLADQVKITRVNHAPEQEIIYIRARFSSKGEIELLPIYEFSSIPTDQPEFAEYYIQFLDDDGQIVAEHPVAVKTADENQINIQSIHALLPKPEKTFHTVQIVKGGKPLASRPISKSIPLSNQTPILLESKNSLSIDWSTHNVPAIIRFSQDGTKTWTAVGIDLNSGDLQIPIADLPIRPLKFQIILADGGKDYLLDWYP